ncbi:hypothetical protein GCM10009555_087190 [Acrocarpospora macrocephala]|uniref:SnoaL-like domain-containing protein n=1 Tax=Acrocarpospora macrocephala TaxID=150177 RepID=A0A5M3WI82_9ACTN|nr:nuclear transport factor 2 family protein [Acrocarpospora macrocephala]GES08847.1 hypothetical protein Amac_024430 [Acrocarpospora macrocephala]
MTSNDWVDPTELLQRMYTAFNSRNIDELLATMSPDVDWPDMIEGTRLHGPAQVRTYWLRQFDTIDPHVEPQGFTLDPDGRIITDVHQVVRNHAGETLADQMVQHVYTIRNGLIERMDVQTVEQ